MGRHWRAWWRSGEQERRRRGLGVGDAYRLRGQREARFGSWGEGDVDMGRRRGAWWRSSEQERRKRGPGGSLRHLGERERRD